MGILYEGYCYPDVATVTKILYSQSFVNTPTGPAAVHIVFMDTPSGASNTFVQYSLSTSVHSLATNALGEETSTSSNNQYWTSGYLPYCETVGNYANSFTAVSIDPVQAVVAVGSGFALVLPLFLLVWSCSLVLNMITGRR